MIVNCNIFINEINDSGIQAEKLLNFYNFLRFHGGKIMRKLPGMSNYNINFELLSAKDDFIIIFDGGIKDVNILKEIAKYNNNKKLIFYYWNPVKDSIDPSQIPSVYEKWSYSPVDCKKYGMNYNSTFYFKSLTDETKNIDTDICFIGKDKGRKKELQNLKNQFENEGFTTNFYITATHPRIQKIGYKKNISYRESLEITSASSCVLDYYEDPSAGLSLRAMESLFFNKKLITNNETIKDYDFYNSNNIFILGQEQRSIKEFMLTPLRKNNTEIQDSYLFETWLLRFGG